jgi:hypothetical protein
MISGRRWILAVDELVVFVERNGLVSENKASRNPWSVVTVVVPSIVFGLGLGSERVLDPFRL